MFTAGKLEVRPPGAPTSGWNGTVLGRIGPGQLTQDQSLFAAVHSEGLCASQAVRVRIPVTQPALPQRRTSAYLTELGFREKPYIAVLPRCSPSP